MKAPAKALIFFLFMVSALAAPVSANPFLGSGTPSVRPPSATPVPGFGSARNVLMEKVAVFMEQARENPSPQVLIAFFGALFAYGVIHAAGPGHRKGLLFAIFISRKSNPLTPLLAGFYSSALHSGSSILILLALRYVFRKTAVAAAADAVSSKIEGYTLLLLVFLSLSLILIRVFSLLRQSRTSSQKKTSDREKTRHHSLFILLTVTSLFPCPGAMLLLLFSLSQGLFSLGIAGVAAMSAGMGVVISAVGFIARSGRETLFRRLERRKDRALVIGAAVEIASYSFLMAFSLWLAWPFAVSLFA